MKPSVILYKALPDDLLQRLQEHFTVHQVANLSPQTVEQNAAIFAEAEGLLGSNENVDAAVTGSFKPSGLFPPALQK